MANQWLSDDGVVYVVLGADVTAGDIDVTTHTVAVFYDHDALSGETVAARTRGAVLIEKNVGANVFAVGDTVDGIDTSSKAALAAAGDGTLGVAAKPSSATDTHVAVLLNGP